MNETKARKIQTVYQVVRVVILIAILLLIGMAAKAQTFGSLLS